MFLLVQLIVPLRGIIRDKLDSRGDFSWNMYSKRYSCRVDYDLVDEYGRTRRISHKDPFYPRKSRAMKVFHRDSLPWFHAHLCERVRESRFGGELYADVSCAINNGDYVRLVAEDTDICTAPNYGVLGR